MPLASVMAGWPEAAKNALQNLDFANATIELPEAEIDAALKKGKISLAWKVIRSRIKPALAADAANAIADTEIQLPLPAIVPLFMARRKPSAQRKTVAIADSIPNFFAAKEAPASAPLPVPPTAPVSAPAPESAAPPIPAAPSIPLPPPPPLPKAAPKKPLEIGDVFGQPGKANWDLNEIVQSTASLTGVSGAVLAMSDGLLIAGQLGEGLDSEAVAGFLPETFTRLLPFISVLKFAEPDALTFIVDDIPLQVRKAGTFYFAVLGNRSQPLPQAELSVIGQYLAKQSM